MLELKILPYPLGRRIISIPEIIHNPFTKEVSFENNKNYSSLCPRGTPHLVSSIKGKIDTLVIKLPTEGEGIKKYNISNIFAELASKIKSIKTIIVIYHNNEFPETSDLYRTLQEQEISIILLKITEGKKLISWIQDIFYPVIYTTLEASNNTLGKQKCWVIGQKYSDDEKSLLTELLKTNKSTLDSHKLKNLIVRACPIPFNGGDILVDGSLVLVGKDSKSTTGLYQEWFGVTPIYIGFDDDITFEKQFPNNGEVASDGFIHKFQSKIFGTKQPFFHIDLFITLAGLNHKNEYLIVVGEPMFGFDFPKETPDDLFNFLHHWINKFKVIINNSIKDLKVTPSGHPIKIIRNPLVLTYEDDVLKTDTNMINTPIRNWFWTSYNNCLVQINGDSKKVWLPSYGGEQANYALADGTPKAMELDIQNKIASRMNYPIEKPITYGSWSELEKFDNWNKRIWESLNFDVCLLYNNYIPIALDNGSLNCITNCITRVTN